MDNLQKRPLSHKKCIRSDYFVLKIIASILLMSSILFPILLFDDFATCILLGWPVFPFFILGVVFLIFTLKIHAQMASGKYYIYLDTVCRVAAKTKSSYQGGPVTYYYVYFKNNEYKKRVHKFVYQTTYVGEPYYIIQPINASEAFAAYPANYYYLDDTAQPYFRKN